MKKIIIVFLLLTTVCSCKKDRQKQYSTWYINGQKFTTNDVRVDAGKAIYIISSNNFTEGFSLTLFHKVSSGTVNIDCDNNNPTFGCLAITHLDTGYIPKPPLQLAANLINRKSSYLLREAWFYNSYRPDEDSILVKGVFNEP